MSDKKIHQDMIIGEIVGMFPEATDIMLSYGLHCVGCHVNMYETLEQGVLGHGMTEEHLSDMLEELNDCWQEVYGAEGGKLRELHPDADKLKISITKKAAEKIIEIAEAEKKSGWPLRIKAKKSGGKTRFAMDFEKEEQEYDKLIEKRSKKGSVKIILDKRDYETLNNIKIDYVNSDNGAGFKISPSSDIKNDQ